MIKRFIALMFTMLVLGPLPALANEGLIVVYDSGEKFYIDEENYEIVFLTTS